MPLKDELTLPTKLDAIAVRPESLPVPTGKTERRELRTVNGKTFVHAEKAADGKEIRTFTGQLGAVCYRDDDGQLRSIDTTIRDLGTHVGVEWAPYKFRLHETGIGFDFESREGGQCTVSLTGIGGEKFEDSIKPEVSENVITYRDVRPGCDIVFKCLNERVKTLRILRDDKAPRTFDWMTQDDILRGRDFIVNELVGTDSDGKALTLTCEVTQIDRASFRVTETWTGETQGKTAAVYPVEIDPSVTVNPAATNDDGVEYSGIWDNVDIYIGAAGVTYYGGVRFPSVAIDNGVAVTLATLGLYARAIGGSGGSGDIYGRAADNPGQFDISNLPSSVTRTTASTAVSAVGTTGAKTWNVTSIAQEQVNKAGWSSGNAMALMLITSNGGTNYTIFKGYEAGSDIPYLSITYTTGGGTSNNLLLLGCG